MIIVFLLKIFQTYLYYMLYKMLLTQQNECGSDYYNIFSSLLSGQWWLPGNTYLLAIAWPDYLLCWKLSVGLVKKVLVTLLVCEVECS